MIFSCMMIRLIGTALCVVIFFIIPSYYLESKPRKSSYGALSYFDMLFLDWTIHIVRSGLLKDDHWLISCPNNFGCIPTVNKLDNDRLIMGQLLNMTPAGGFAYVLTRRLAELVTRIVCCWIIPVWLIALATTICTTGLLYLVSGLRYFGRNENLMLFGYRSKHVCLLLSLMPLMILVPFLLEIAYGGVLDFQLQFVIEENESSFWKIWEIFGLLRNNVTPSILDLFQVCGLTRILFGKRQYACLPRENSWEKLCLQIRISFMYWSSAAFVISVCLLGLFLLKVIVIGPVMNIVGVLTSRNVGDLRTVAERRKKKVEKLAEEKESEHCEKKVLKPGDKREASIQHFSTNLYSIKEGSSTSEKLMKQFDKYDYPDPEILLTGKGDSRVTMQPKFACRNSSFESGDSTNSQMSSSAPVAPRFFSRAISANLERDSSDE